MNSLTEALTKAAENLSGHPCNFRWRKPARADAVAIAFELKGADIAIIDFDPCHDWWRPRKIHGQWIKHYSLYALSHEADHVRDLWIEWGAGIPDYPSGSIHPPQWVHELSGIKQIEQTADDKAWIWYQRAKSDWRKYIQPYGINSEFDLILRALGEMRP